MRRFVRTAVPALLAGVLTAAAPLTALAAGPFVPNERSKYDEATWARLEDNKLEYDEIPLLVHEYNSSMMQNRENLEKSRNDLIENAESLESFKRKLEGQEDSLEASGDIMSVKLNLGQQAYLEGTARGMRAMAGNLLPKSTVRSMQTGEDTITQMAQSMMVSYDNLRRQRDNMSKLQELYDRQYQIAVNKKNLGMATDKDVYKAQTNQLSAQANLHTIDAALLKMKPTLCTLTGWPGDADPEIASVPALDLSQIASMNLEEDTRKAIGNNATLIEQRHSAEGKTKDGDAARLAVIEEGDEKMTIKMKTLYDDVAAKKTAYDAALAGYQSAEKSAGGYERMYKQGLMAESDYLGAQITFYQKKAAYESADAELRQAFETYQWAVKGLAKLD